MRTTKNIMLIITVLLLAVGEFYAFSYEIVFLGITLSLASIVILSLLITNARSWKKLNASIPKYENIQKSIVDFDDYPRPLR